MLTIEELRRVTHFHETINQRAICLDEVTLDIAYLEVECARELTALEDRIKIMPLPQQLLTRQIFLKELHQHAALCVMAIETAVAANLICQANKVGNSEAARTAQEMCDRSIMEYVLKTSDQ